MVTRVTDQGGNEIPVEPSKDGQPERPRGDVATRYDADVWEAAFLFFVETRSGRKVEHMLREYFAGEPTPSRQAIEYRAHREGWEAKADALAADSFPALLNRTLARLALAGPQAAQYLSDVAAGREKAEMPRIAASQGVLDRIGVGPKTERISFVAEASAQADAGKPIEEMTPEELEADNRRRLEARKRR